MNREEDVKKAYGLARVMGHSFAGTHVGPMYYMDEDDYIQEAIIAWWEKRHIPYRLVEIYRNAAPLGRRDWVKNKHKLKSFNAKPIEDIFNTIEVSYNTVEKDADKLSKLKRLQKIVNDLDDPREQTIIIMKYVYDLTLVQIAAGLGISGSYAGVLHRKCLKHLKEEILNGN